MVKPTAIKGRRLHGCDRLSNQQTRARSVKASGSNARGLFLSLAAMESQGEKCTIQTNQMPVYFLSGLNEMVLG